MKKKELKIILTKGIPGSGKSTWAKQAVKDSNGEMKRINKDDLRAMIDDKWTKEREKYVLDARDAMTRSALLCGKSVVIDDTNIHQKHEDTMKKIAAEINALALEFTVTVEVNDSFLQVPIDTCIRRDLCRPKGGGRVGIDNILRMAKSAGLDTSIINEDDYINLDATRKTLARDENLQDCIICDLDGTLSLMCGNRSPFEAEKCGSDLLNEPVARVLMDYADLNEELMQHHSIKGTKIILFSGRSDAGLEQTKDWLRRHRIYYDELHMRKDEDMRNDAILKKEMYETHIKGKYNVIFILDDRNQVVDMWRDEGLLCLQCYYGDF
jgi:predicted kinase